ncbi:MAG: DUF2520 domain-containing protein [Rhodoferax sp.]|uniref:Rossmann-like and DUF2520 domain-containing protein n=1 Tax=Rhodoferax sp. TaxID=50421 RepID=UPI001B769AFE|nr:Rossmann-like and DUF2520 domain-containing protein [Rhodoferax sp.]MBP8225649.1 DUF2520 domain-containing protein [Acidovorax sp.]MBP9906998.1 DUF2520 domain-containing protein [Rhodoferax sp.]
MITLNLIGAGRVGQTLGRLFQAAGVVELQGVLTRSAESVRQAVAFMGAGQACTVLAELPAADIWLLAVPDAHIATTSRALSQIAVAQRPALAFHCSGALACDQLQALRDLRWQVASAHPLLSFARPELALTQFAGTPCALEGDATALRLLDSAFTQIGAQCFAVAAHDKLLYHAAAVFATNFLPVLQDMAEQLWQHSGMPPALIEQMRGTLLHNAVNNIVTLGPKAALTGPAARGDLALVAAQARALVQWNAQAGAAYQALSQLAVSLSRAP